MLLVAPMSGHFATLLRGTVKTLLQDHDVYITDWHNPRDIPLDQGKFGLDEYTEHLITFLDKIGPDYLDIAFRAARAADPVARLVYNDFGVEFGAPDQLEKRRVLLGLIDGFKERGTPIDAIGLQSHLSIAEMAQFDDKDFGYFLDELAARGLEVMLTELDCIDKGAPSDIAARDAAVAAAYRRYLDVALANRAVTTVINWGLSDRQSWIVSGDDLLARRADGLRPRPLPFDTDLHPKPAYRAIAEALRAAPPRAAPRG